MTLISIIVSFIAGILFCIIVHLFVTKVEWEKIDAIGSFFSAIITLCALGYVLLSDSDQKKALADISCYAYNSEILANQAIIIANEAKAQTTKFSDQGTSLKKLAETAGNQFNFELEKTRVIPELTILSPIDLSYKKWQFKVESSVVEIVTITKVHLSKEHFQGHAKIKKAIIINDDNGIFEAQIKDNLIGPITLEFKDKYGQYKQEFIYVVQNRYFSSKEATKIN